MSKNKITDRQPDEVRLPWDESIILERLATAEDVTADGAPLKANDAYHSGGRLYMAVRHDGSGPLRIVLISAVPCPTFTWCKGHIIEQADLAALGELVHYGDLGTVTAGKSTIRVEADLLPSGELSFNLGIDGWEIPAAEIDNECADIESIARQARELMCAWRIEHFPEIA